MLFNSRDCVTIASLIPKCSLDRIWPFFTYLIYSYSDLVYYLKKRYILKVFQKKNTGTSFYYKNNNRKLKRNIVISFKVLIKSFD